MGGAVEEGGHLPPAVDRFGVPARTAASSAVTAASGARSCTRRLKSPSLAAAMNASTTSQSASWSSGVGWRTLARAREASLRAATGVVSRTAAIVGNSKPKLSCSTNATRSWVRAGRDHLEGDADRVGERDIVGRVGRGLGHVNSAWNGVRARSRSRHNRVVTVVNHAGRLSISASVRCSEPGLLHDVLRLGVVGQHAAGEAQ